MQLDANDLSQGPRWSAIVALNVALQRRRQDKELANLSYHRQLNLLTGFKSKALTETEYTSYFAAINAIAGTNVDPKEMLKEKNEKKARRYRDLVGMDMNDEKFVARLNSTIDAMYNL